MANYVYVVEEGRIRLYLTSSDGEEKTLAILDKMGLSVSAAFMIPMGTWLVHLIGGEGKWKIYLL